MKMKILHPLSFLLLISILLFSGSYASSQQSANVSLVNQFLQEVYADCPEYQDEEHVQMSTDYLQRTLIHTVPLDQYPECPLLSSASKKNKCNAELDYSESNFSPESFNPLKYHFQFFSSTSTYFRVDGQNYIIEIKPKN
jgi:hypothetical protein